MPSDFRQRLDAEARAVDTGASHPQPGTPRWDAQFGRGWATGLVTGGVGFMGGLAVAVIAGPGAGQVRGLAFAVASFAAMFQFAFVFLVRYGIGFGWQNGVIWPDEKPVKFALIIGIGSALAIATIFAAGWGAWHADVVAQWVAAHQEHPAGRG